MNNILLVAIELATEPLAPSEHEEFKALAAASGGKVIEYLPVKLRQINSKYFIGSGKAEEIRDLVKHTKANLIIFNQELSPGQERNLTAACECRVIDRTGLILDIFARRARTFEGKLQVELAQLQHLSSRLVRIWQHLERQKGGIGMRGGPGEKQLETDRRLIRDRIVNLKKQLEKVKQQRSLSRRQRKRSTTPTVALVGYTNSGKSTLFNTLTKSEIFTANQLFATLDPTLRKLHLPDFGNIILIDTVGFIRDLPHTLVDAFCATLEETVNTDLLLHVVDVTEENLTAKLNAVNEVLTEIGAEKLPQLIVYNKIDLMPSMQPKVNFGEHKIPKSIWISAEKKDGIGLLLNAISKILASQAM